MRSFDVLEDRMARAHAQRTDGWPVGPELKSGAGWYSPARTVQILEDRPFGTKRRKARRFLVYTFFPFRRIDLRYPPIACATVGRARITAFDRMREAGAAELIIGSSYTIDLSRCGDVIGLEAFW